MRRAVIKCLTATGFKSCQQNECTAHWTNTRLSGLQESAVSGALLVATDTQPIQQLKIRTFILLFRITEMCYQYPCRNYFSREPILLFDERVLLQELILLNPRSTLLKYIHISKREGNTNALCYLHVNCFICFQYTMKYT